MKKTIPALVIATILLSSFSLFGDPSKDILGKWKIDESSLEKTTRAVIEATRKNNPDVADQMDSNFPAIVEMVRGIEYTYKSDNTYEVETPQGVQSGKWQILENGKVLLLSPEGRPARRDSILELSATRMLIINRERGDTTLYIHPKNQ